MSEFTGYYCKSNPTKDANLVLELLKLHKYHRPNNSNILGICLKYYHFEDLPFDQAKNFTSNPDLTFAFNNPSTLDLSPTAYQAWVYCGLQ